MPRLPLPEPSRDEATRESRLRARIAEEMEDAGGAIPFDRYMDLALNAPGLGYYASGAGEPGPRGDFITAPEVSPLFGRCIASQCAEILDRMNGGTILELGAGSGRLAQTLLAELEALGRLPDRHLILETSAALAATQRECLAGAKTPTEWLDRLPDEPFTGIVLANEVIDALPCARFCIVDDEVREQWVAVDAENDRFAPVWRQARAEVVEYVGDIAGLPSGHEGECHPVLPAWIATLAETLASGALLFLDYGESRPVLHGFSRPGGTLRCHYRQLVHSDPFVRVGLQDITADVDFTALAQAGMQAGLTRAGFTTQAHFLIGCGIDRLLARSDPNDAAHHLALTQQAKTLLLPDEMGERFKAMGFLKNLDMPLTGFSIRDLSDRLKTR